MNPAGRLTEGAHPHRSTRRRSPPGYPTGHINRFGEHGTRELGVRPEAYDPKPDVDFTPLREQAPTATGLPRAA
ncbi:hypothetical protein GCM10027160_01080 [Streptomyces calidiresistens]